MLTDIERFILGTVRTIRHVSGCQQSKEHRIGFEKRVTPLGPLCRFVCGVCGARSLEIPVAGEEMQRLLELACTDKDAQTAMGVTVKEGEYMSGLKAPTEVLSPLQMSALIAKQAIDDIDEQMKHAPQPLQHDQMVREDVQMAWDLIDAGFRFDIPPAEAEVSDWQWRTPRGRVFTTTQAAHKFLNRSAKCER